ncbi:MAG: TonB-dependent receptor [Bacteroidales bacterium]
MKIFLSLIIMCVYAGPLSARSFQLKGMVTDKETGMAIEPAVVAIPGLQLWALTNEKGYFILRQVPAGRHTLSVSCLGYEKKEFNIDVTENQADLNVVLSPDNLALKEVVITAKENQASSTSAYTIDKTALDHHQLTTLSDLSALLPGGKTVQNNNPATTSAKRFEIRSTTGELGNPSFMTALEVDGIRLSNNASFSETAGIDSRNMSTGNIESVEVITGIPSVEYGDVSSGIVKVKTQKGYTPLQMNVAVSPNTKTISLSKGLDLRANRGILNVSLERSRSIADIASPYTSYQRNAITAIYTNTFGRNHASPLHLSVTLAGNIGGYDSKSDPDAFVGTFTRQRDHTLRGAVSFDWLLNKPFLTSLSLKTSLSYSDKLEKVRVNKSASTATPVFHGMEEGYFVATDFDEDPNAAVSLIPPGYWYQLQYRDDRPVNADVDLKLSHHWTFGKLRNSMKAGISFSGSKNSGQGVFFDDPRYTPTWRPYRYDQIPMMRNGALYAEYMLTLPIGKTTMQLTGGIRRDQTTINNSGYGRIGAWSPRFNGKYILWDEPQLRWLKTLKIRGGIGNSVKLPSFALLYPTPDYQQQLIFTPGASSDGTAYYAYYIKPSAQKVNPLLKWQFTRQAEAGFDMTVGQMQFSLTAWRNKGYNSYMNAVGYTPFTYKFTDQKAVNESNIPWEDRIFSVNRQTGVVTVSDRSGVLEPTELPYRERVTFHSQTYATNSSPLLREGLEWILDLGKIPALFTALRIDGNYYHYKGINQTLTAHLPTSSQSMADGAPYKYIGYYVGGNSVSNGSDSKRVNLNATFTTHIPKVRLVVSLRIESTLYYATRYLSEYKGQPHGFVLDDRNDYEGISSDIYGGDRYVGVYPLYYVSADDINTKIPFEEKFSWAKQHDRTLYNELAKLVVKSNSSYYFNQNRISPWFSANLSVTKELGKRFSLSFYAHNFLNNLSKVTSGWNTTENTLFDSSRIPGFYYGMTLRVKL